MDESCVSLNKLRAFSDISIYYVHDAALGGLTLGTE